jgi:hypothetical protein
LIDQILEREKVLKNFGWDKVKDDDNKSVLTSVYTKKETDYDKELEQLKLKLASFRG